MICLYLIFIVVFSSSLLKLTTCNDVCTILFLLFFILFYFISFFGQAWEKQATKGAKERKKRFERENNFQFYNNMILLCRWGVLMVSSDKFLHCTHSNEDKCLECNLSGHRSVVWTHVQLKIWVTRFMLAYNVALQSVQLLKIAHYISDVTCHKLQLQVHL